MWEAALPKGAFCFPGRFVRVIGGRGGVDKQTNNIFCDFKIYFY